MRELTKSMFRLSWAVSLQGAEKVYRRLQAAPPKPSDPSPSDSSPHSLPRLEDLSPENLSWLAGESLGSGFREAFQAGAEWQAEWIDQVTDALVREGVAEAASEASKLPSKSLRFFRWNDEGRAVRQEFRNRFEAYRLVSSVREWLNLPEAGHAFDLKQAVEQALSLDRHRALWATEGLGHAYGEAALARDENPRDLLSTPDLADLPEASLAMLHAGMGLAFAQHLTQPLTRHSTVDEVRSALEVFAELCHQNARPGLAFGALEALGLITRGLRPELGPAVEEALVDIGDEALYSHAWHGIGRAIYFSPIQFVPGVGTIWHAIEMARREAPTQPALDAALVGVGMACTLVNLSHPIVLEALLEQHGDNLEMRFFEGLVSAVVLRHDHSPDLTTLDAFLRHRPAKAKTTSLWEARVQGPCKEALASTHVEERALPSGLRVSPEDRAVPFTTGNAAILQLLKKEAEQGNGDAEGDDAAG